MLVSLLLSTALAATPNDARATFDRYEALSAASDPAVAELFADDATVRTTRDGAPLQIAGAQYKQILATGDGVARAVGDLDTYKKVKVKADGTGFLVTAHRTSGLKCTTDKDFAIRIEERGESLVIVDMYTKTVSLSQCAPGPELAQLLEQARAGVVDLLPLALDDQTRLDAVEVQGSALIYRMTLVNVVAAELDVPQMRQSLAQVAVTQACGAEGPLKPLTDRGATVRYSYKDKDGTTFQPLDVSPSICARVAP